MNIGYLLVPLFLISILSSLATFPILSLFLCIIFSIYRPKIKNKIFIFTLLFIISLNLSIIYSGKNFYGGATDFGIYFQFYQKTLSSTFNNFFDTFINNENHFEPLYYLLNITFSKIFGDLTEVQFSILMNMTCIYGLSISTFIYISKFNIKNLLFLVVISIFISKIGSVTLFWRQSLAAIFIILFLSRENRLERVIYLMIAIGFHTSSIIVAPLCYLILRNRIFNGKRRKAIILLLIGMTVLWPIFGKEILISIVRFTGLSSNSFFINNMEHPYYLDTMKTIVFSVPILLLYLAQNIGKPKSLLYNTLIFEILILIAISTIPHSFRIIYPISIVLIYVHTSLLLIQLNRSSFILGLAFIFLVNFFRLTSSDLYYQLPLYSSIPFYYFND